MTPRLTHLVVIGLCSSAFSAEIPCAKTTVTIGKVLLQSGIAVRPGLNIKKGDTIRTGEMAGAKFLLLDDSIVDLGPSTVFTFKECLNKQSNPNLDLELALGSVRAAVNKEPKQHREKFHIRTRSSVLAVRGTELYASFTQDSAGAVKEKVGVSEGKVEILSQFNPSAKPVTIDGGQQFETLGALQNRGGQTIVVPNGAPLVAQFSGAEQKALEATAKVNDPIFQNSIELPSNGKALDQGDETAGFVYENLTGQRRQNIRESEETKDEDSQADGEKSAKNAEGSSESKSEKKSANKPEGGKSDDGKSEKSEDAKAEGSGNNSKVAAKSGESTAEGNSKENGDSKSESTNSKSSDSKSGSSKVDTAKSDTSSNKGGEKNEGGSSNQANSKASGSSPGSTASNSSKNDSNSSGSGQSIGAKLGEALKDVLSKWGDKDKDKDKDKDSNNNRWGNASSSSNSNNNNNNRTPASGAEGTPSGGPLLGNNQVTRPPNYLPGTSPNGNSFKPTDPTAPGTQPIIPGTGTIPGGSTGSTTPPAAPPPTVTLDVTFRR